MKESYPCTVFVDGKLWVDTIDDMNSTALWAEGGIIFLSERKARAFCRNLRLYPKWRDSKMQIRSLRLALLEEP